MGAIPVFIELNEDDNFALTKEKIIELKVQIVMYKPKIVWIANPNNPTGSAIEEENLEEIVCLAKEHNTFVVIDEAYIKYLKKIGKRSMIKLTKYDNMMVLRTFSKAYGLTGMRIGYLISSSKDIIEALLMLRIYFPVTQLALNMANLALSDKDFLKYTQKATKELADKLFCKLEKSKSFRYISTATNIIPPKKNTHLTDNKHDIKIKEKELLHPM